MKSLIIGLGSKAQIGKDYAAIKLAKYYDVHRIAFADVLKEDISYLFAQNQLRLDSLLNEPHLKKLIRPLLVSYGGLMRKFNENTWVDRTFQKADFSHQVTIITDMRYPNEVAAVHKLGGYYVDIISDIAPANEEEALYSPMLSNLADFRIVNNFDDQYIKDMKSLIDSLLSKEGT